MGFRKIASLHQPDNGKFMFVIKNFLGIRTGGLCVDMAQNSAKTIVIRWGITCVFPLDFCPQLFYPIA